MNERVIEEHARTIINRFGIDNVRRKDRNDGRWTVAEDLLLLAYPVQSSRLGRSLDQMDSRRCWLLKTLTLTDLAVMMQEQKRIDRIDYDYIKSQADRIDCSPNSIGINYEE